MNPKRTIGGVLQVKKFGCLGWLTAAKAQHWATWRLSRTKQQSPSSSSYKTMYAQEQPYIPTNGVPITEPKGLTMFWHMKPSTTPSTSLTQRLVSTHKMWSPTGRKLSSNSKEWKRRWGPTPFVSRQICTSIWSFELENHKRKRILHFLLRKERIPKMIVNKGSMPSAISNSKY